MRILTLRDLAIALKGEGINPRRIIRSPHDGRKRGVHRTIHIQPREDATGAFPVRASDDHPAVALERKYIHMLPGVNYLGDKRTSHPTKTKYATSDSPEAKTVLHTSFAFDSGNSRKRFPVAANTALHNAGANGGTPGSPTPAGGASLSTMCTSTLRGARSMRVSW